MGLGSFLGAIAGPVISGITGMAGAKKVADSNADAGTANAELQREFAQNGIQWKVKDAKKAGIHPLFGLGAQTFAASPSFVGDTGVGSAMSNIGQDVSRAIDATRNRDDRVAARMGALQLERGELENQLLRSQIAKLNQTQSPALPTGSRPLVDGQGDAHGGLVRPVPLEPVHHQPGNPAKEVGKVTDYGYAQTDTGMAIVPSVDVKERIEDNLVPELLWSYRNLHVLPPRRPDPKAFPLPPGHRWAWNPFKQEFQPYKDRKGDFYNVTKW